MNPELTEVPLNLSMFVETFELRALVSIRGVWVGLDKLTEVV